MSLLLIKSFIRNGELYKLSLGLSGSLASSKRKYSPQLPPRKVFCEGFHVFLYYCGDLCNIF